MYVTITIQMPERVDQCLLILLRKLYVLSFCVPTQGWQLKPKSRWVNLMNKPFQGSSQFTETFLSSEEEKWAKMKILTSWDWLLNLFSSFLSIDFQGDEIFRSTKLELSHISLLILFYRDLLSFRQMLMFSAHDFNEILQFLNFLGLNY